jgi:hypothetical protein
MQVSNPVESDASDSNNQTPKAFPIIPAADSLISTPQSARGSAPTGEGIWMAIASVDPTHDREEHSPAISKQSEPSCEL